MSKGFAPTLTQGKNRPKTLEAQALSQRPDCFHGWFDIFWRLFLRLFYTQLNCG